VDKKIQESGTVPMGPYFLTDLLGLDTVLHVAEHLHDSYGERFYVSSRMRDLVEAKNLGLKTLVESCLVLEEGVASAKDIEVGMMMGAGILPGPFARADDAGLDTILEQLEHAQRDWGDNFEPPSVLKRLVAQGRLGRKTGQGFFAYPQPDEGD